MASGESVRSVACWVAGLPEAIRGGRGLGYAALRLLLRRGVYCARVQSKAGEGAAEWPPGRWEPLVDDATWQRVQGRLDQHRHMPRQASRRYLLTGLLRCPRCGGRLKAGLAADRASRYRCWGHHDRGGHALDRTCHWMAPVPIVDAAVLAEVAPLEVATSTDAELMAALRREWQALRQPPETDDRQRRRAACEQTVERARQRITRGTEMYVDGHLDRPAYEALCSKARADIEGAEAELGRLLGAEPAPSLPPLDVVLQAVGGLSSALRGPDVAARREVLGVLIDHVTPERIGRASYRVRIAWTPAGEALRQATAAALRVSAA